MDLKPGNQGCNPQGRIAEQNNFFAVFIQTDQGIGRFRINSGTISQNAVKAKDKSVITVGNFGDIYDWFNHFHGTEPYSAEDIEASIELKL